MWLALRLELTELSGAYFAATFLWFFATREICSWRPSPVVDKGYDIPFFGQVRHVLRLGL